jgi:transcriptional regulator with XRE-family HTH domain
MPLIRELDPSAGPLDFFGAELRRARTSARLSQEQLGQRLGYSGAQVGKVETGERSPSQDFAEGCDRALDTGGLFLRIYQLARRWGGPHPQWFRDWLRIEQEATALHWWEPILVPGLLQTADYARALFRRLRVPQRHHDPGRARRRRRARRGYWGPSLLLVLARLRRVFCMWKRRSKVRQ